MSLYFLQYLEDADLEIVKPLNVFFNRKNVSIVHGVVQFFQKRFPQPQKRMFPDVVLSMLISSLRSRGRKGSVGNIHDWMKDRKGSLGNVYDWRSLIKGLK